MIKLEEVLGGSVQFHFNIAEKLHKIVVISEGLTYVFDEDEVMAMLKIWTYAGESLDSDRMAVDLVNRLMKKDEDIKDRSVMVYTLGERIIRCDADSLEVTEG